ncbi:MAG: ATP-binding protein [Clostridiales bacterium]|jgi:ethanolamine utilization cobalamin adenosyltransferase|uniref:ATP-binding protein n=1 Tax=Chordicoccus furentiruminis TaxID=2709410 RepID=UPI0023A790EE|nr:ATP-binding protein [Chordicoccus furentiruminis]MCI6173424.1 ATP-binding protein [Clostridiales bacterium]
MKAITEEILRYELRNSQPEVYVIPEGKILTPAAREYLQQRKIRFQREGSFQEIRKTAEPEKTEKPKIVATPVPESEPVKVVVQQPEKPKYEDYETGAFYYEKPEHMTQLFGNKLVTKDHPRILFRGKLDSLQSLVVLDQALICASSGCGALVQDLGDILKHLRELMRCDVLDEPLVSRTTIGLTHEELREHSHNPMKFYNIKQMVLPDYSMGTEYALLNQLRSSIRETEVAACSAFREGSKYTRSDIIEELNRLSSALHIMMCKYLAGQYDEGGSR